MNWRNNLTVLLNIEYPFIQAPMLGVTSPEMVAAISNEGGLGSLPVGGLSPEKTRDLIRKVKSLTDKPFAVNLFAHNIPGYSIEEANLMRDFLYGLKEKHKLDYEVPQPEGLVFYSYDQQIPVLIEEKVPIVSFTFGIPDKAAIMKMKQNGIVLIGTATCTEEVAILENYEVDAITLQGIEAGGHRGTFINGPLPQIGLMALIPMAAKAVNIPLIASGAINSGATIRAAMTLGAVGVQVGTAFINSDESIAIPAYKKAVATAKDNGTKITKAFSGRWARGIVNALMQDIENAGISIPPYPVQNSLTGLIRNKAQKQNNDQLTNLWAGQATPLFTKQLKASEIFRWMITDTENSKTDIFS